MLKSTVALFIFITFGNLKDGLIRGTRFDRTAEQRLEKLLQDKDPEKIQKACTSLGAEFTETKADWKVF